MPWPGKAIFNSTSSPVPFTDTIVPIPHLLCLALSPTFHFMDKSGRITLPAGLTVWAYCVMPPPKSEFGLPGELLFPKILPPKLFLPLWLYPEP